MTGRPAQIGSALGLGVMLVGLVAMSQLGGPADPSRTDQSSTEQICDRMGAVPRSAPSLPPPTVDELLAALLAGVDLQPPGLLLIGELCNGMQVWADPDHADQVRLLNERVYSVEGTTLGFVPAHVRACDRNGDGLINGLDLQPFVTEALAP